MLANVVEIRTTPLEPGRDGSPTSRGPSREHPGLPAQKAIALRRLEVLTRSGVCGDRATATLHLVLEQHAPRRAFDEFDRAHLTCRECRPSDRDPAEQYPCPTAQRVIWALEAALF